MELTETETRQTLSATDKLSVTEDLAWVRSAELRAQLLGASEEK